MHFKNNLKSAVFLILVSSTGCGLLGAKVPPKSENNGDTGCLNESKNLIQRYTKGEISEAEWRSAFDCIDTSLQFFTEYVRGSSSESYNQADMYNFVSRFIITNRRVDRDLLTGLFELKTALLGGQNIEFRKTEIVLFKSLLPRIRDISAGLIPAMRMKAGSQTDYRNYLEIADLFDRAGAQLADLIGTLPVGSLRKESIITLLEQVNINLGTERAEETASRIFLGKWIAFNSRPDQVDVQDWTQIIRSGMKLTGLGFAVSRTVEKNNQNESVWPSVFENTSFREFLWDVATRIRPTLDEAVQRHGGFIPFPLLDRIVDEFKDQLGDTKPQVIKDALRPIFRKLLNSSSKMGLDQQSVALIFSQGDLWIKRMRFLDQAYESHHLDPLETSPEQLKIALERFESSLEKPADRKIVADLRVLLLKFKPQFYRDTKKVYYMPNVQYTQFQHHQVILFDQLVHLAHDAYGSIERAFTLDDLKAAYQEFIPLLFGIKMLDITVIDFPKKILTYIDVFTQFSDGDAVANYDEIISFAFMLVSTGTITKKLRTEITDRCQQDLGEDILGWKLVSADCFRNEFFGKFDYWIESFPRVKAYWQTLTLEERERSMRWIEHGSRRRGYTQIEYGSFDFKAVPSVLHYMESMFTRFDTEQLQQETLNKTEIFNAYPVFKTLLVRELKKKIPLNINSDYVLRGVFAYLIKHQNFLQKPTGDDIKKLAWTVATYRLPTTKVVADRLSVFNIVCNLSVGDDVTPESTLKICQKNYTP
jgi:hypothetical protein